MPAVDLSCGELVELVTDYLEGRLTGESRVRFERHLDDCAGCRNYVEQIRATVRLTGALAELPAAGRDALLAAFRDWKRS